MISRWYIAACLIVLVLSRAIVGQVSEPKQKPIETNGLRLELESLQTELPRWRSVLAAVDVESLPVQYREGKQIEFLKSVSLGNLDSIETASVALSKKTTAIAAVQLLLNMQDAQASVLQLASAFMVESMNIKEAARSPDWAKSLLDLSTDIATEEKHAEVPVMTLVAARDALLDICVKAEHTTGLSFSPVTIISNRDGD